MALVYALFICFSAKALYEDYKKGKVIPLIPKESDKIVLYLCFPVFIPFLLASRLRVQSNRISSKKYRTLVLSEYFDNDAASLDNYEKHVASRCGTFDPGFHKVLYEIRNLKENEITFHKLYDMVNKVVQLCNITIDQKKISQAAYDILSCFFKKKYKESDTQRILRLRKAGYNVRPMQLYKNEENHPLKCDFEGKENCCPKNCNTCAISIKTEADMCQVDGKFQDAINKYIEALQKEPTFAEAWNILASAYGSIGEHS